MLHLRDPRENLVWRAHQMQRFVCREGRLPVSVCCWPVSVKLSQRVWKCANVLSRRALKVHRLALIARYALHKRNSVQLAPVAPGFATRLIPTVQMHGLESRSGDPELKPMLRLISQLH